MQQLTKRVISPAPSYKQAVPKRTSAGFSAAAKLLVAATCILLLLGCVELYRSLADIAGDSGNPSHSIVADLKDPKQPIQPAPQVATPTKQSGGVKPGNMTKTAAPLTFPILWWAPFFSASGYGDEAISYVKGLVDTHLVRKEDLWIMQSGDGVNPHVVDGWDPKTRDLLQSLTLDSQAKRLSKDEKHRQTVIICHSFPDFWLRPGETSYPDTPGSPCPNHEVEGKFAYKIGRTMFETATLPSHLVQHAVTMDEVWVPTEFNKESFANSGVPREKIFVVPQGINTSVFDPTKHQPLKLTDVGGQLVTGRDHGNDKFVFLSVFKWETRKGWPLLLDAFLNEFKVDEAVELHIITHPFMQPPGTDLTQHVRNWIHDNMKIGGDGLKKLPTIYLTSRHISDADYPRVYKASHALVVPTRGEGWGRPQMEAMSMELPVITTNWSGPTAFLDEEVGYPIRVDNLVTIVRDSPNFFLYFEGSKWAEPSVSHLKELMRHVKSNYKEAQAKGKKARERLQEHFSPEAIAFELYKQIQRVEDKLILAKAKSTW